MSRTAMRMGSFALVLAGSFGTAYAIGERLPGHDHSSDVAHDHAVSGPIGFELVSGHMHGGTATYQLRDPNGAIVTEFAVAHGALLHAVIIRPDLSGFQHVHPEIGSDGSWSLAIDQPGPWHLVFESTPVVDGAPVANAVIVTADVDDGTDVEAVPLPAADDTVDVDGLLVMRDGFTFTVASADGSAASDLEPFLGQVAHLVAFRQQDLAFTHLHPLDSPAGAFDFGEGVTEAGTYRLFLQFGHAGDVLTVPFTVVIP